MTDQTTDQTPTPQQTTKVLTWFRRTPGMSVDDFRRYWREEHPKAVLQMPGLLRYQQNHVTDAAYVKGQPFCDGVAETWWESTDVLRSHRDTPQLEALLIDEAAFIDPANRQTIIVDEVVITDGVVGPGALKQFSWLRPRADLSMAECQTYWRERHGPLAATIPGIVRYVQNHASPSHYRDRTPPYIGLPIAHLASLETAKLAMRSPELAATRADEANFLSGEPLPFVIAEEHSIL